MIRLRWGAFASTASTGKGSGARSSQIRENCPGWKPTFHKIRNTNNRFIRGLHTGASGRGLQGPDQLVKLYGPLANHSDLDLPRLLSSPQVIEEPVSYTQEQLLHAALKDFLPDTPGSHRSASSSWLPLGHQQVHFRPKLSQADLLPDGTDTRFLPGSASIWQYRLWAGGSVSLLQRPTAPKSCLGLQQETVEDIRIIGNSRPERVFVSIRKDVFTSQPRDPESSATGYQSAPTQQSDSAMTERYTLCFLRDPPRQTSETRTIKPPTGAAFTHTLTPNANLLFQFSALTHNAHKIHLDPSYARQFYKLKAPVVHGPLIMVILLEFMRAVLAKSDFTGDEQNLYCQHIDYRNFAPLYVDEEFTLCCKPSGTDNGKQSETAKDWQVWVQTGSTGYEALAVRGNVRVAVAKTE